MSKILTPNYFPVNRDGLVVWLSYRNSGAVSALGTWKDCSGYGNDGTLLGASFIDKDGLNTNGSGGNYVDITDSASIQLTTDFTLSAWVYPRESGVGSIIAKGDPYREAFLLLLDSSQFRFYGSSTGAAWDYSSIVIGSSTINTWQHVCVTLDSVNGLKTYKNGVTGGTSTAKTLKDTTGDVLRFGNRAYVSSMDPLSAKMDDIQIYNRALSAGEIKQLYLKNKRN